MPFTFTVPQNINPLIQTISASGTQFCSGGGNIQANMAYNGWGVPSTYLVNTTTNVEYGPNTGGVNSFSNLSAGSYVAELRIANGCGLLNYTIKSDTIKLLGPSQAEITRSLGLICNVGTAINTGQAQLSIQGVAPYRIEYKLSSASAYTVHETANASGSSIIENLQANESYDIRVTDNCGTIVTSLVSIGDIGIVHTTNSAQPCENTPYVLSVPDYLNASYTWEKGGLVVATTREITFPSFTQANSGEYVCTIVINNCVEKIVTVTLYSQLCNTPITDITLSGNVFMMQMDCKI